MSIASDVPTYVATGIAAIGVVGSKMCSEIIMRTGVALGTTRRTMHGGTPGAGNMASVALHAVGSTPMRAGIAAIGVVGSTMHGGIIMRTGVALGTTRRTMHGGTPGAGNMVGAALHAVGSKIHSSIPMSNAMP